MTTNFHLAPPSFLTSGNPVVPIDIDTIDASLTFDGANSSGSGDATLHFVVGDVAGRPLFDLRQTITGVWLDGAPLPVSTILTIDAGGGPGSEVRVLDQPLAAGSTHTLRFTYSLGVPAASTVGSYLPRLNWAAGPRLTFNFGFTDLGPGRYLEAWIPANLIWDQYTLNVEVRVTGTTVPHRAITNGTVTTLATNHWQINFPARFTALSPLLEVRATDSLESLSGTVVLPSTGSTLTVDALKPAGTAFDLATNLSSLQSWLHDNDAAVGSYPHGNRFLAFLIAGGMEYEGACTATPGSLEHEAFHSWWGRGVKPASGADGWWDEAWNTYHDLGGTSVQPFDFTQPPVVLSNRNPYSRTTPSASYSSGARMFSGIAALSSPSSLTTRMNEFLRAHVDRPVTSIDLETHLLARLGLPDIVDGFHRFVYGFSDPAKLPDLWIRDDPTHTGTQLWQGRFWDSPDLWIRNNDDNGTTHQSPIAGRDNWFYARVRNQGGGIARHFAVTFNVKQFAGVEFSWPGDFVPAINAAVGFDLAPGQSTVVKARWPAAAVPPAGTHACWVAAVIARGDHPANAAHVWEHGNLAQKNLTIARFRPGKSLVIPFVVRGLLRGERRQFEFVRPKALNSLEAQLVPRIRTIPPEPKPQDIADALASGRTIHVHDAAVPRDELSWLDRPDEMEEFGFDPVKARRFRPGRVAKVRYPLSLGTTTIGLVLRIPPDAEPLKESAVVDLVQRDDEGRILGGIAIELRADT